MSETPETIEFIMARAESHGRMINARNLVDEAVHKLNMLAALLVREDSDNNELSAVDIYLQDSVLPCLKEASGILQKHCELPAAYGKPEGGAA